MKFLTVLAFLFVTAAHASRPGDFETQKATEVQAKEKMEVTGASLAVMKVYSVTALCPNEPKCKSNGMGRVTIVFNLENCGDELGQVAYKFDGVANKLYVSAINLNSDRNLKCVRQMTKEVQFTVGGADDNTEVINLGE